mmetsp:Transcript_31106/g.74212  ORF Transcript_31106/g.74212 Transcript_31106/m.74212 type:complete len:216 (-) Transcript_31106:1783-2430(-)
MVWHVWRVVGVGRAGMAANGNPGDLIAGGEVLVPAGLGVLVWHLGRHVLLVGAEVLHVLLVLHGGHVWRLHAHVLHVCPRESREPFLGLDVLDTSLLHRQTLGGIGMAQALHQGLDVALQPLGKSYRIDALLHLGIDLHGVRGNERSGAAHELIDEDPQRPPINRQCLPGQRNHLRGEVLWCATRGVGLANDQFGQAQVCQLHVPSAVQHDVLRL